MARKRKAEEALTPEAETIRQDLPAVGESTEIAENPDQPKFVPCGRRELPCRVTDEEKREAAQKMARAFEQLEETQARKKSAASQYKAEEEAFQGEIQQYARIVRNEFTHRSIEVQKLIDYAAGEARIYRIDTGDEIERRRLSESEMQTKLDIEVAEAEAGSQLPLDEDEGGDAED